MNALQPSVSVSVLLLKRFSHGKVENRNKQQKNNQSGFGLFCQKGAVCKRGGGGVEYGIRVE